MLPGVPIHRTDHPRVTLEALRELTSQPFGGLHRRPDAPPRQLNAEAFVDQSRRAWDRHSALVTVATIIGIAVVSGVGTRQLLACLFCALTFGFYLSTRRYTDRTSTGHRRWIALGTMGGLVVLFAVAVYFEFWAGFLMAALCPIAFFSAGMVYGHGVNAAFCAGILAGPTAPAPLMFGPGVVS